jgi:hypothetical protein
MTRVKLPGFPSSQEDWTLMYCKVWVGKVQSNSVEYVFP